MCHTSGELAGGLTHGEREELKVDAEEELDGLGSHVVRVAGAEEDGVDGGARDGVERGGVGDGEAGGGGLRVVWVEAVDFDEQPVRELVRERGEDHHCEKMGTGRENQ